MSHVTGMQLKVDELTSGMNAEVSMYGTFKDSQKPWPSLGFKGLTTSSVWKASEEELMETSSTDGDDVPDEVWTVLHWDALRNSEPVAALKAPVARESSEQKSPSNCATDATLM